MILLCQNIFGQRNNPNPDKKQESAFNTIVPKHLYDIVLCRPTNNAITVSVLFYKTYSGYIEYWSTEKNINKSSTYLFNENEPSEILLNNLQPNTLYHYRLFFRQSDKYIFSKSEIYQFQTKRNENNNFSFTITADSHLDQNADTLAYKTTLLNAASDSADFHFDLGDTFMTDKYRENYKNAINQYIAQRYYYGLLCNSSPLFFVQGNHDGESSQRLNGNTDNMTVWSNITRKKYFPNPIPNEFYTGNFTQEPFVGFPQNYYAFGWGNTQFIVLDPFWFTPRSGNDNPWDRTLGKMQYDWLKTTLASSKATFKFIFIHNLVGGVDIKGKGRGGAEVANLYEWGGKNPDGSDGFKVHRPDWEMPIHDLLVKNKVTAVFHGHDHIFACQELDGIVYQCLSQPGNKEHGNTRNGEEYGYTNGKILNEPGYLRVKIDKENAVFDFVTTYPNDKVKNKTVSYSTQIKVKKQ